MKAAVFDYVRPRDVGEALSALKGNDAKPIAGGQSLGPMLNLRLARPKLLVDVSRIQALREIQDEGEAWRIGASVTHAELEDRPLKGCDPLASVARAVAYRAVRNRGTVGGSLAHADPAADWPLVFATLDATLRVMGFGRAGPKLRGAVEEAIVALKETGRITTDVAGFWVVADG